MTQIDDDRRVSVSPRLRVSVSPRLRVSLSPRLLIAIALTLLGLDSPRRRFATTDRPDCRVLWWRLAAARGPSLLPVSLAARASRKVNSRNRVVAGGATGI